MEKPRVYGSEDGFRAALAKAIRSGEELLDQTEGTRKRMELAGDDVRGIEDEWERRFRKWFNRTGLALADYLQEQLPGTPRGANLQQDEARTEALPVLANGLPPDDGKPRHRIGIDNGEEWLSKTLDELRQLQSMFPPPAKTAPMVAHATPEAATSEGRFRTRARKNIQPLVIALVIAVVGALIAAFIAYKLGWV